MDMEAKMAIQQEEINSGAGGGIQRRATGEKSKNALPREPPKHSLQKHRLPITAVVFHPVFTVVASASEDASVMIWDFESGEYERTLKGHTNAVQALAFDKTGAILATASADLTIKLWDFKDTYACTKTLRGHDHNISGVIFMPSGDQVVSCSRDKTIKLWEVSTGYCVKTLNGHTDWVRCLVVNETGTMIASAGHDQSIMIWDAATGTCTSELRDHDHVIHSLAISGSATDAVLRAVGNKGAEGEALAAAPADGGKAAGQYLVSGSRDKTVRVWSIDQSLCLMTFVSEQHER
jgi:platelet-activating factor acetylhydrolase IB subunit alpha